MHLHHLFATAYWTHHAYSRDQALCLEGMLKQLHTRMIAHIHCHMCSANMLHASSTGTKHLPDYLWALVHSLQQPESSTASSTTAPFSSTTSTSSSGSLYYSPEDAYDVIVVGAGHAGCEAALAAARMGCKTLLLTLSLDRIAWQPCNPAVGGPAKSQLVHEVDAMGGEIGKMADRCYLQKRVLNRSKVSWGHASARALSTCCSRNFIQSARPGSARPVVLA